MTHMSRLLLYAALVAVVVAAPVRGAEPDGAKIYKEKCAFCHGKEGTPLPALAKQGVRDFNDPEWAKSTDLEKVRKVVDEGTKGTLMRSFAKELSAEEIGVVSEFVLAMSKAEK